MDIDAPPDGDLRASIDLFDSEPLGIHFLSMSTHHAWRSGERISRDPPGRLFMQTVRDAPMRLQQQGLQIDLDPGDSVLIDGGEAYDLYYAGESRAMGFSLPRDWFASWTGRRDAGGTCVFRRGQGWKGEIATKLAKISSEPSLVPREDLPHVANHLGSLLALSVGEEPVSASATAAEGLLAALRDTLRGASHETTLTPAQVAARHGISLRYLHLLFARAGSSFGADLMSFRIAAGFRMLTDTNFDAVGIGEVALRSGFRNASHFARVFRRRYGMTPRQARTLARS